MKNFKLVSFMLLLVTLIAGCGNEDQEFPNNNINLIVPSSAGGGNDVLTRGMSDALDTEGLVDQNIVVDNNPGGGGEVAWQNLSTQNDGHHLSLTTSLLLTNYIRDNSDLSHEDLTPIATLASEWLLFGANPDTGLESIEDLIEQLQEDPSSLTLAFGPSLGGDHHLLFLRTAVEAGIDPSELNITVYDGGGEVTNALLGGHVDVVTHGVAALSDHYEAGSVNLLAISSDERIDDLPDVPTLTEQGYDIVFPHWRGVMGPPNMSEEEISYWENTLENMSETQTWNDFLDDVGMNNFYLNPSETEEYLSEQSAESEELLRAARVID